MPRRTNDGLNKRCCCPKRRWPKCSHAWHVNFHHAGAHHRYSLDAIASHRGDQPPRTKADAVALRDRIRAEIRAGTFQLPRAHPAEPPFEQRRAHARRRRRSLPERPREPGDRRAPDGVLRRGAAPRPGTWSDRYKCHAGTHADGRHHDRRCRARPIHVEAPSGCREGRASGRGPSPQAPPAPVQLGHREGLRRAHAVSPAWGDCCPLPARRGPHAPPGARRGGSTYRARLSLHAGPDRGRAGDRLPAWGAPGAAVARRQGRSRRPVVAGCHYQDRRAARRADDATAQGRPRAPKARARRHRARTRGVRLRQRSGGGRAEHSRRLGRDLPARPGSQACTFTTCVASSPRGCAKHPASPITTFATGSDTTSRPQVGTYRRHASACSRRDAHSSATGPVLHTVCTRKPIPRFRRRLQRIT